jgi:phosphohistidine phosphatase SixA
MRLRADGELPNCFEYRNLCEVTNLRMKLSLKLIAIIALLATLAGAAYAQESPTTVIVVRHAEKVAEGNDPGLSEAGAKRADELSKVAEDAGVTVVYTTQYKRTQETARPLASRLNISVVPVEITKENAAGYAPALAKMILSKNAGQVVMVIGHSNTVPLIVEALGGKRPPPIADATEFDKLFIVIVPKSGPTRVVKARYGSQ